MVEGIGSYRRSIVGAIVAALLAAMVPLVVTLTAGDAGAAVEYTVSDIDELYDAMSDANADSDASVINLELGVYRVDVCSEAVGGLYHDGGAGTEALTINGNGSVIRNDYGGGFCEARVLTHKSTGALVLNDVTLTNGITGDSGAGLWTLGATTLDRATITENESYDGDGGGVYAEGADVILQNGSSVDENIAYGAGGGIYTNGFDISQARSGEVRASVPAAPAGSLIITGGSSVDGNRSMYDGGGIAGPATSIVVTAGSTVDGNFAGIHEDDVVLRTEISGSVADELAPATDECVLGYDYYGLQGWGGGISAWGGPVTIADSSVSGNVACNTGGGIAVWESSTELRVESSQVDNNAAGTIGGGIAATGAGVSVIGGSTVDGNQVGLQAVIFDRFDLQAAGLADCAIGGDDNRPFGVELTVGGGIASMAGGELTSVRVDSSSVSDNVSCGEGGGIAQNNYFGVGAAADVGRGAIELVGATVDGNAAYGADCGVVIDIQVVGAALERCGGSGGGVLGSFISVTDSSVSGNFANSAGGGILTTAVLDVARSAVNENVAENGPGGGVYATPFVRFVGPRAAAGGVSSPRTSVTVSNSTVSSNASGYDGGGIYSEDLLFAGSTGVSGQSSDVTLEFATVALNEVTGVLGVALVESLPAANVHAGDLVTAASVIALPVGGANCSVSTTTSGGYNFSDDESCGLTAGTDLEPTADAALGVLSGGAHTPSDGSALIDSVVLGFTQAGTSGAVAECGQTDQVGTARPQGIGCDVGAIEVSMTPPQAIDDAVTAVAGQPITIVVLDNDDDPDDLIDPTTLTVLPLVSAAEATAHGVAVANDDGTITYTSDPDYSGTDSFQYEVCASALIMCTRATVSVTVSGVTPTPLATPTPTPDSGIAPIDDIRFTG